LKHDKNEVSGFQTYLRAAQNGFVPAEFTVAMLYEAGRGTTVKPRRGAIIGLNRRLPGANARAMLLLGWRAERRPRCLDGSAHSTSGRRTPKTRYGLL
jgi:hypothetical protein